MPFNEQLQRLRRAHGLSQEELAARIGVSRQAVSKWEVGEAAPDLGNLLALADALGVSLDALCGREDAPPDAPPAQPRTRQRIWPYLLAALAGVALHSLLLLLVLNLHEGDIRLGTHTISVASSATAPVPSDGILGEPTDLPAPSPVLPEALSASNLTFSTAEDGTLTCTFCTSAMDAGWTCTVTFAPEDGAGAEISVAAEGHGSFWRADAPVRAGASYSVAAAVSDGVSTRVIPLASGLTRSAHGAAWTPAEN